MIREGVGRQQYCLTSPGIKSAPLVIAVDRLKRCFSASHVECNVNRLMCTVYATSNNMKLVHWPLIGVLLIWYSKEGTGRGRSPPRPLAAANVTAHPSTASVPITVLLYNDSLICSFSVPIKRLHRLLSLSLASSFCRIISGWLLNWTSLPELFNVA